MVTSTPKKTFSYNMNSHTSEDPDGSIFQDEGMPDMASNAEDLARRGEPEAGQGDHAASSSGSFKHLYSSFHQNIDCKWFPFHMRDLFIYVFDWI